MRKLWDERATEAVLEFLEDTRVGCWTAASTARRRPEDVGQSGEGEEARKQMITGCANDILHRGFTPSESDTEPPKVGPHWTRRFLERHPEFKVRSSAVSIQSGKTHTIRRHLRLVRRYKALADETGFRIGGGKNQWIVTRDPSREMCLGSCTNRDFVTICEAISGDGTVLPPMAILSGVLHKRQW